jgi:hypothetical protein
MFIIFLFILINHIYVYYSLIGLLFHLCYIYCATIKFTAILFVRSFNDTSRLKRKPLSFQMNINKDLSENGMNLDDDVLYNFIDASSQLMRDDGITPWKGPQERHPLFYQTLLQTSLLSQI